MMTCCFIFIDLTRPDKLSQSLLHDITGLYAGIEVGIVGRAIQAELVRGIHVLRDRFPWITHVIE
jgi:hypothetical protein